MAPATLIAAVIIGLLALPTAAAGGSGGQLDRTFSGDGRRTLAYTHPHHVTRETVSDVAIDEDGRTIAAGSWLELSDGNIEGALLARFRPSGRLDKEFGRNGTVSRGGFPAAAVAMQPNGRILVALGITYYHDLPRGELSVARYLRSGKVDRAFGENGVATAASACASAAGSADVAVQGDGRIVVAGTCGGSRFAISRHLPNGDLDPAFSGDGIQTTEFPEFAGAEAESIELMEDGKIVVAGEAYGVTPLVDLALARYRPGGALDPSFSGDGRTTIDRGGEDHLGGIAIAGDGLVAAGSVSAGTGSDDFAITSLTGDGSLDQAFGHGGTRVIDFGLQEYGDAVSLDGSGRILLAGTVSGGGVRPSMALARFRASGAPDRGFGREGFVRHDFGKTAGGCCVALDRRGRIVVAGSVQQVGSDRAFALARYLP